ncbi:MerR family transcriptional regulator [Corynebacterium freiburgense]|uniref:MerR family transcriptional regulator n=1 Tax=Corynebacterium freiburgense TaxID=556548 RepID=UPI0003FD3359|nr:MerR family transcriptional regulator [Corynebacterium freiburgense]WJZ01729.1 HTH-type transcriptional regulator YfmP [Corynebacterium freiburgense]
MRISDLAEIAGVSVRTIRHYHNVGILPLPARRGAWRNYGIDDLERLLVIRTLAEAGVPLSEIPHDTHESTAIEQAISHVDAQIATLLEHRHRLESIRRYSNTTSNSLMSAEMLSFYERAESAIRATGSREALRFLYLKKRLVELGIRLGFFHPDFALFFRQIDQQEISDLYLSFAQLGTDSWTEEQCYALAERAVDIVRRCGPPPAAAIPTLRRIWRSRTSRLLVRAAYPAPGHQRYSEIVFSMINDYLKELETKP